MPERIRHLPVAIEDHTIPEYRPKFGLGRWFIRARDPNAKVPHEDPDIKRHLPGFIQHQKAVKLARRYTLRFDDVSLHGPLETFEPQAMD